MQHRICQIVNTLSSLTSQYGNPNNAFRSMTCGLNWSGCWRTPDQSKLIAQGTDDKDHKITINRFLQDEKIWRHECLSQVWKQANYQDQNQGNYISQRWALMLRGWCGHTRWNGVWMRIQCHYNMNVHASKQEGRETCAQKQYLTVSKFTAGRETKDEQIIYTSPLPSVNIETVEKHMECHQH